MKLIINKLQKYGRNSVYVDFFKYSFVVIFIMFMIIMATFAAVYCYNISYNQKHNLILENNKINAQLVSYFNIADNIYYQYIDEDVEKFLNCDDYNIEYIRNSSKIQDMLRKIINISQHIDSIYLYTVKSDYVFSTINSNNIDNFDDLGWYNFYKNTGNTNFSVYSDKGNELLSKCYGITYNDKIVGMLILNIKLDTGRNITNLLLDSEGNFLSGYKSDLPFNSINMNGCKAQHANRYKSKYIAVSAIDANYNILSVTDTFSQALLYRFILVFLLGVALSTVIAAIFSFKHAEYYYKKVSDIVMKIQTISDQNSIKDENEIEYVKKLTVDITSRYENIQTVLVDAIKSLNEAQNKALQAQINPHFLFNTLNAVNCLILQETNEDCKSIKIIELLSDILGYIMDNKRNLVKLSEEIEYTKKYIEIELIKKNYSFDVEWNIEDIRDCYVIKMILQPIVENAIYHGVRYLRNQRGVIQINVSTENDNLVISVVDNGNEIDETAIDSINESLRKSSINDSGHIGLRNVNERIKIAYGDTYGCKLIRYNEKTECKVILPCSVGGEKL